MMMRKTGSAAFLFGLFALAGWGRNPVVFLHGWNGDRSVWEHMRGLLESHSGYEPQELCPFNYYSDYFGFSAGTPIEDVAEGVAREVATIYYGQGGKPVDLVTHCMGGLIVRAMLAYDLIDPKCIGRFVAIAVPNAGQAFDVAGKQLQQMKYGAPFLWELAKAWHFRRRSIPETLCVIGINGSISGSPWDGLIHHWSAGLEKAELRYVYKRHSSAQLLSDGETIYECSDGVNDPVFRLVSSFLTDGTVLDQSRLGFLPPREVYEEGGMFYRIVHPDGSGAAYGTDEKRMVNAFLLTGNDGSQQVEPKFVYHGSGNAESQPYGIESVFGTMPAGRYRLRVNGPDSSGTFPAQWADVYPGRVSAFKIRTDGKIGAGGETAARFDPNGGSMVAGEEAKPVLRGEPYGKMPTPVRKGYLFAGWRLASPAGKPVGPGTPVDFFAEEHTLFAAWVKEGRKTDDQIGGPPHSPWRRRLDPVQGDGAFAGDAVYEGFLVQGDAAVGTISVRAARPSKAGSSRIRAAVQTIGGKRVSLRGAASVNGGPVTAELRGRDQTILLTLGADGMTGSAGQGISICGARNVFQKRGDPKGGELDTWKGEWTLAMGVTNAAGEGAECAYGAAGLTLSVQRRGKACVRGMLPDGTRVNARGQLILSQDASWACVPVFAPLYRGRPGGFSFLIWLNREGVLSVEGIGEWDASGRKPPFHAQWAFLGGGRILPPKQGAWVFRLRDLPASLDGAEILPDLLPSGQEVVFDGRRLVTPRRGKVSNDGAVQGENPSGLHLSYLARTGSFNGSFSLFAGRGGKVRRIYARVNGVFVNGVGRGFARVSRKASMAAALEEK